MSTLHLEKASSSLIFPKYTSLIFFNSQGYFLFTLTCILFLPLNKLHDYQRCAVFIGQQLMSYNICIWIGQYTTQLF